jgi:hypothetical protein
VNGRDVGARQVITVFAAAGAQRGGMARIEHLAFRTQDIGRLTDFDVRFFGDRLEITA